MKTTKCAVILLALVLLTAATARPDEKPANKEISNTKIASCLVKITTDPSVLPGGIIAIDYLMHSSGVAGKAAREVLEISPDITSGLIEIEEIESIFPDLAGVGVPTTTPGLSTLGTTTTNRLTGRTTPTAERTPSRPPTTTTSAYRPTTPGPAPGRPPTRRTPTPTAPRRTPTVTQPLPSTTEETILFRLHVDFSMAETEEPIKPAAEEFMMALIDNFRSALRGAFDEYKTKFNQQLDHAREEADHAERELVQTQAKLRDISGSRDLSRQAILRDISGLRKELQSAIMKRASDETLYETTASRIAEEQARRKKLVEDDPISKEFQSILDVHERRLKATQKRYESGSASAVDLEDIEEKIIRARIDLIKRQEEVSNPPGSIALTSLSDELANLSAEVAVAEEEIHVYENQLKEAEALLEKADSYELLSLKGDIAKQNLEETLLWQARLGRNIRSIQPPDVTVIGAE